ncbi:alpha-L-fucosidase [Paenibacillus sp. B01]|uniref:alpha-L-fucosidase n=1 Tax=Paenibacillus sp. B01 TaxID=2660554 RepID=UPI00129A8C6E|nr:alpha-L-fucosidase [Paenibacillus sp. B01]QGG58251.1 alpha-L-fucosidase [Paenibacillus sp. B01]
MNDRPSEASLTLGIDPSTRSGAASEPSEPLPAGLPLEALEDGDVQEGVHNYSREEDYVWPDEPLLRERLEWFRDQKLGLMMHWGPYSQLGIVESWALDDVDAEWSRESVDWTDDPARIKREVAGLNRTFNPLRFQPERWAELAADNGFRYLNFTTKHHDGFCMWDTKTTGYSVTGRDTPFHTHPYADVCRALFDAFRARGLAISAYFSKADWHTPYYWSPDMPRERTSRGPSYDPAEHPSLWEKFVSYTHEQLDELLTHYGRIDMLWLDAGWVGPRSGQDIRLGEAVERARLRQPWLLSADRTIGGPYENVVTPEQTLPERPMFIPWESCITMGTAFSFRYEDEYKSVRELVHLLVEIVAKGGNLALNVAPQPDGRLPRTAIERMNGLGAWLRSNGEAIYGTRPIAPYGDGSWFFTAKQGFVYAIRLYAEGEAVGERLELPELPGGIGCGPAAGRSSATDRAPVGAHASARDGFGPAADALGPSGFVSAEALAGPAGDPLPAPLERSGAGWTLTVPERLRSEPNPLALVFRLTGAQEGGQ